MGPAEADRAALLRRGWSTGHQRALSDQFCRSLARRSSLSLAPCVADISCSSVQVIVRFRQEDPSWPVERADSFPSGARETETEFVTRQWVRSCNQAASNECPRVRAPDGAICYSYRKATSGSTRVAR